MQKWAGLDAEIRGSVKNQVSCDNEMSVLLQLSDIVLSSTLPPVRGFHPPQAFIAFSSPEGDVRRAAAQVMPVVL